MIKVSGQVTLSTNEEAEALMQELEDEIEKLYGGKSAFWRSCLMNYNDKHRIQAKIDLIEQRIEQKKKEINDLEIQKKGLESELDEMTVQYQKGEETVDMGDKQFWDKTVRKIFVRESKNDPASIQDRWRKWFDGRYQLFTNRFSEITVKKFRDKLFEEARDRGYSEKIEELEIEVEA